MTSSATQDLPVRGQPTSGDSDIDLLPLLSAWLETTNSKISAFWIGAEWRAWARYELYLYLEEVLGKDYLIYHTFKDIWDDEVVDIYLDPRNSDLKIIAIVLRCERVNENCGSFEDFRAEMDGDIERIKGLGKVDESYEGSRLCVVGLSGPLPAENEDTEWKCKPAPRQFESGEVNGWIYEMQLQGKD